MKGDFTKNYEKPWERRKDSQQPFSFLPKIQKVIQNLPLSFPPHVNIFVQVLHPLPGVKGSFFFFFFFVFLRDRFLCFRIITTIRMEQFIINRHNNAWPVNSYLSMKQTPDAERTTRLTLLPLQTINPLNEPFSVVPNILNPITFFFLIFILLRVYYKIRYKSIKRCKWPASVKEIRKADGGRKVVVIAIFRIRKVRNRNGISFLGSWTICKNLRVKEISEAWQ